MPSTLSQNIASAEGEPQPFLKAQKRLINLTLPIIFHFIMPCNLPTLPSSCPSDTASHIFGGRGLDDSPENFNLTLISTPFNTHLCQINPLRTVGVKTCSPQLIGLFSFISELSAAHRRLLHFMVFLWLGSLAITCPREGLALWVYSIAVQVISSIQEKYSTQQEDEVEVVWFICPCQEYQKSVKDWL